VDAVNGWFAVLSTLHPPTYDEGFYFATWEGYGEGWMNALGPNHSTDGWVALFNVYSGQNPSCQAYWVAKIDGKLDEDHLLLYLTPEQAEACGGQLHPLFNVPETYF
jgi:hypothetical protein